MNNTDAQNKAIHAGAKTKALKGKSEAKEPKHDQKKLDALRNYRILGKHI